jgi:hypothetical protein
VFERFGLVDEMVSDSGVQFTSAEFTSSLTKHGISHSRTALYSPQANAAVERANRVIKEGLKAGLSEGKKFKTALRQVVAAYRMTAHARTEVSPASLMLAFSVQTPLSGLTQPTSETKQPTTEQTSIKQRVQYQQKKMAEYHDRRTRATPTKMQPGDEVRILLPRRSHKLAASYSEPRLVDRVSRNTVRLRNGQRWNLRRCIRTRVSFRSRALLVADLRVWNKLPRSA